MKIRLSVFSVLLGICLVSWGQVGDLPRSHAEDEGMSSELVKSFVNHLANLPEVDVHHLMMLRHGKVIGEWHAAPYQAEQMHTLYSASKTVTAMAVGLAVDDGLLTVDDKVSKHLRDKMPATLSPALDSLTVRNLLMMAAGREPDLTIPEGEADWELAPDSVETAGWGLRLQAESEAKLGQLMLQQGQWQGRQLVSQQWMHDMTQRLISTREESTEDLSWWDRIVRFFRTLWHTIRSWFTGYNIDDYYLGYGYQTKAIQHPRAECYFAAGYGGQLIYVVPSLDLVVVINGRAANYGDELNTLYYHLVEPMLDEEVLKAAPVNLAIEMPQGEATSPLEERLFASSITLEDNLLALQTIDVDREGDDRVFTMTDKRGPLRAVAACGQWRITTGNERPIYIMESREQLVGTHRPFTSAAAYAWQGDTLALRLDWLDGGDNRRLRVAFSGDDVTVFASDNFDPLLTDTIHGKLGVRN